MNVKKGSKSGILRVFKFIKGPDRVLSAPLVKAKNDKRTLKTTKFPRSEKDLDSWKTSETPWKRGVSNDEFVRSWITAHLGWRTFHFSRPSPGSIIYPPVVFCLDLFLRSSEHEGEWLKGKAIGFALNYIEPIDPQEIKDFYSWTITTADRIIQHIEETI